MKSLGKKVALLGSSLVAALAVRNAVAEGKAGAAACFSELSKVFSCKPFIGLKKIPKQKVC